MRDTVTIVWTKFTVEGWHRWPSPQSADYLHHYHRHLFHFTVAVYTTADNERTVEFHRLAEVAKEMIHSRYHNYYRYRQHAGLHFHDDSCEIIANNLTTDLVAGGFDVASVECSEDGECGATVHRSPYSTIMKEEK